MYYDNDNVIRSNNLLPMLTSDSVWLKLSYKICDPCELQLHSPQLTSDTIDKKIRWTIILSNHLHSTTVDEMNRLKWFVATWSGIKECTVQVLFVEAEACHPPHVKVWMTTVCLNSDEDVSEEENDQSRSSWVSTLFQVVNVTNFKFVFKTWIFQTITTNFWNLMTESLASDNWILFDNYAQVG